MRILLVNPSKYDERGLLERYRLGTIPPSGLVHLASRAKRLKNVEVKIVDEWIEDVPFQEQFDLVCVSTLFSSTFPRVVDICRRFRERGIPVVVGGTHATCSASEAAAIADSVVVGEGERLFEEAIEDLLSGAGMKPLYKRQGFLDLENEQYVEPDYSLLDLKRYMKVGALSGVNIFPIQTSRGCPMNCAFCSIHITAGYETRYRPIANVVNEIRSLKKKHGAEYFCLYDDNLSVNPARLQDLMNELSRLDVRFWCQISSTIVRRPEMIEMLAKGGCVSALVGIESINRESLEEVSKTFNDASTYKEMFKLFRRYRVAGMASMMFGFDHDGPEVFSESVRFLNSCNVPRAVFHILVPFPGTRLHATMTAEGRIEETNLSLYDVDHAVFRPRLMAREQLEEGLWCAFREFYKIGPIVRRVVRANRRSRFYTLYGNLVFRRQAAKRELPYNSGYRRVPPAGD